MQKVLQKGVILNNLHLQKRFKFSFQKQIVLFSQKKDINGHSTHKKPRSPYVYDFEHISGRDVNILVNLNTNCIDASFGHVKHVFGQSKVYFVHTIQLFGALCTDLVAQTKSCLNYSNY